jgi:hypothetical protein
VQKGIAWRAKRYRHANTELPNELPIELPSTRAASIRSKSRRKEAAKTIHADSALEEKGEQIIQVFNAVFGKRLATTPGNVADVTDAFAAGYEPLHVGCAIVAAAWGTDRYYRSADYGGPDLGLILKHKGGTNPRTGKEIPKHLDKLIGLAAELDLTGRTDRLRELDRIMPGLTAALHERGAKSPARPGPTARDNSATIEAESGKLHAIVADLTAATTLPWSSVGSR